MSTQPIQLEALNGALPYLTPDEKLYAFRLLSARAASAPPPKPVTAEELVRLETDLPNFVKAAWPILHPGRRLCWDWSDDLVCEYLMAVRKRQITRLILNVSPRTGKTTKATICFPDWQWATDPGHSFLCASYSQSLSVEHSIARRHLILSPWYQALFGESFHLSSDQNRKEQFDNSAGGQMIATSVGGTATGKGGDTAIVDDPVSMDQALSEAERKNANDWMDHTLRTRLNDPATGAIIIIMQRGHELDPTGYCLDQERTVQEGGVWTHVSIPLEAERQESIIFPLSGREVLRERDSVIQQDRFSPATVQKLKAKRLTWAGQYQQRPAPVEGNLIKRSEVRYYGGKDSVTGAADEALPDKFDMVLLSADCAFKDLATSDYVAIGTVGVKGRKRYLLNLINSHLDAGATEDAIVREREKQQYLGHNVSAILVEDKANGPAVIKRLKQKISGVIAIDPQGGKVARMFAAAPEWQAGDWYVDRTALWSEPFIQQITMFPGAAHDDMADMMSQASIYLQAHGYGLFELWRQQAEAAQSKQPERDMKDNADMDERFRKQPKVLGKVMLADETTKCPQCGCQVLARYSEGAWKCNECGASGRDGDSGVKTDTLLK